MARLARGPQYKFAGQTDLLNGGLSPMNHLGVVAKFIRVEVKNAAGTAVDLSAQDDADGEAFEVVIRTIPGLLAYDSEGADGIIHAMIDAHATPVAEVIQNAVRALGTNVGPGAVDVSGTTVVDGAGFRVV